MAMTRNLLLHATILLVTCVAGPVYASNQQTECRLVLQGNKHTRKSLALAHAELNCSGKGPIPVAVNPTYISSQQQQQFKGVKLVDIVGCQQHWAAATNRELEAMIGFCTGNLSVQLTAPSVQAVNLVSQNSTMSVDRAVIVLGDKTHAHITDGVFEDNNGGSVLLLMDHAQVFMSNSHMTRNSNSASFGVSSGIWCAQNSSLTVHNSSFTSHNATGNGAAIMGNCAQLVVTDSQFKNITTIGSGSPAGVGAAVWVMGQTNASISSSSFMYNQAMTSAGAAGAANQAILAVSNCTFVGNQAMYGGALVAADDSIVNVTGGSIFRNNSAMYGGSMFIKEQGTLIVRDSLLTEGAAQYGGCLFAIAAGIIEVHSSRLINNKAEYGGAFTAEVDSKWSIYDSVIISNMASYGGGLFVHAAAKVWLRNTTVGRNVVKSDGAGIYAGQRSKVVLSGCTVQQNGAKRGAAFFAQDTVSIVLQHNTHVIGNQAKEAGGGVFALQNAAIVLNHSSISHCEAREGGGMHGEDNSAIFLTTGSSIANSTAVQGAGINAHGSTIVTLLSGSMLVNNTASHLGGGAYIADNASITVAPDSLIAQNAAGGYGGGVFIASSHFKAEALAMAVHNNCAPFSLNVGVVSTAFSGIGETHIHDFVSHLGSEKGLLPVNLNVTGPYGLPCDGLLVQASLLGNTTDSQFLGSNRSDSSGLVFMNLRLRRPPGAYTVKYTLLALDTTTIGGGAGPVYMTVDVRSCAPGEITPGPDVCDDCLPGTFSLNPSNQTCDACPAGAECPGGSVVVPQLGMWQSTPRSNQIHKCPNPKACYGDRAVLQAYADDASHVVVQPDNISSFVEATAGYADMQCTAGYTGNLCGQCAAGYGTVKPFTCRACLKKGTIIALYVIAGLIMLSLIKIMCIATMADDSYGVSSLPTNTALQNLAGSGSRSRSTAAPRTAATAASSAATGCAPPGSIVLQPPRASDVMKALLLWMQYLLLVYSLGIAWPAAMSVPLQAVAWLWSAASPETLSPDCLLSRGGAVPLAMQKVLFYLLMPVVMLILLWLLDCIYLLCLPARRRMKARITMKRCMIVTAFVTLFFFLPSLARSAFGMFACIPVDQATGWPYVAAAVGSHWVHDTQALCYDGYHSGWSVILGIPLLVGLCLLVPGFIVLVVVLNHKRLHEQQVRQQYGFLYRPYRRSCSYWEAVVVCQTLALVAVSVYGVTLGPYYQALLFNCTLALIVVGLALVRPHSHPAAGRMMLQSMGCLLATSYVGLSFLPYDASLQAGAVYANVMGAIVLVANVLLLASLIWRLCRVIHWVQFGQLVAILLYTRCGCVIFADCLPKKPGPSESVQGPSDRLTGSSNS